MPMVETNMVKPKLSQQLQTLLVLEMRVVFLAAPIPPPAMETLMALQELSVLNRQLVRLMVTLGVVSLGAMQEDVTVTQHATYFKTAVMVLKELALVGKNRSFYLYSLLSFVYEVSSVQMHEIVCGDLYSMQILNLFII